MNSDYTETSGLGMKELFEQVGIRVPTATDAAIMVLERDGYILIHHDELPQIAEPADGSPKLPPLPRNPDDEAHGGRAGFYRLEALQKLALAQWHEKRRVVLEKRAEVLAAELYEYMGEGTVPPTVVAKALVDRGWRR